MSINVIPYDPEWPRRFEAERAALAETLAPWLIEGVHHTGSTSIPGLAAKPIIDMMAGVRDLAESRAAIPVLAGLGWAHGRHRPDEAHWFHKPLSGTPTHGLHLTEPGSALWRERLTFRDALRADAGLRDEYQALKLRLAGEHDDVAAYTADKREFVARVLAASGVSLRPRPQ
ncbi:GrpB family protein [Plantactinospora sp. GCM10030261]|uniref:GrpB family protein n=1 Tax=Plantactinospora sp. GCM10030261 TaxID=3273420 RepID=UPI00361A2A66